MTIGLDKLTPSQRACLDCGGNCSPRCTGWVDELKGCYIRDTDKIAQELGRPVLISNCNTKRVWVSVKSEHELTCQECGNKFISNDPRVRYCSDECRTERSRKQWREQEKRKTEARKRIREKEAAMAENAKKCKLPECGRMFVPRSGVQRYCCPTCQQQGNKQQVIEANRIRSEERAKRRQEIA